MRETGSVYAWNCPPGRERLCVDNVLNPQPFVDKKARSSGRAACIGLGTPRGGYGAVSEWMGSRDAVSGRPRMPKP